MGQQRGSLPSTFIRQTPVCRSRLDTNTIRRLSGETAGQRFVPSLRERLPARIPCDRVARAASSRFSCADHQAPVLERRDAEQAVVAFRRDTLRLRPLSGTARVMDTASSRAVTKALPSPRSEMFRYSRRSASRAAARRADTVAATPCGEFSQARPLDRRRTESRSVGQPRRERRVLERCGNKSISPDAASTVTRPASPVSASWMAPAMRVPSGDHEAPRRNPARRSCCAARHCEHARIATVGIRHEERADAALGKAAR